MNEEEAFPYWKVFEDATGIKVSFVRMSDATLQSRIADRASRPSAHLGSGRDHAGLSDTGRHPAAVRPAGGEGAHRAGARAQSPLVWRLRQLQRTRLQHQSRQDSGPAENL